VRFSELSEILIHELGPDLGARVAAVICRCAAGETLYIPERPGPPEILPTDTPRRVAERYGVSRRTASNWVNRWRT
jgi:hypothetical protein